MPSPLKVLIAAGGTGGHIYPGLAMAEAFKLKRPGVVIEFVGTRLGLENRIIPAAGYRVHHLPIGRLNSNVSLRERLTTVLLLPWALFISFRILRRESPDFVLGVGGHASGPLLLAAAILRYRSAIWEPNAMPGLANRWLARFVDECWVVFAEARGHLRAKNLFAAGMPVRREIEDMPSPSPVPDPASAAATDFAGRLTVEPRPFRVLVFGGSLGARGINTAVVELVREGGEWLRGIEIVHQTGAADFARVRAAYGDEVLRSGVVDLREYLHDMGEQYGRADLVVARAGAATLSELAACAKPAILVPFPFASDDHQLKNAESLASTGAAVVVVQKELNSTRLRAEIDRFRSVPSRLTEMSAAIYRFHQPRAAEKLVGKFIERIELNASR